MTIARWSDYVSSDEGWTEPGAHVVAPGVYRIPLPLPGDALKAINAFAVLGNRSVTLIDTGWQRIDSWEALRRGLSVLGAAPGDVSHVLVTHVHYDHYGQAAALRRISGAPVALGLGERRSVNFMVSGSRPGGTVDRDSRLAQAGAWELISQLRRHLDEGYGSPEALHWERPDSWIVDGDVLRVGGRDLRVIATPGHTQGHVTFFDAEAGLLFAGDHVLPHITPSIGFQPISDRLALVDFLESLMKVRDLPVHTVLPAHGPPFGDLRSRVDALMDHHANRLGSARDAFADDSTLTALDVARRLVWTRRDETYEHLDAFNRALAVLETAAHLDLLVLQGALEQVMIDGVRHYLLSD